jgi:DNA (cytosine-5)-methyltransferase 1
LKVKFASLFTGMGGADLGAIQAGLTPIWGIEINPAIANLAQDNFPAHKIIKGDVGNFDYSKLKRPDWLHASPPCINASRSKNGQETDMDKYLAKGVCEAIAVLKPDYFSLENVPAYLDFESLLLIVETLKKEGYQSSLNTFDCAQYGVPQSRKRLFLVSHRKGFRLLSDIPLAPVVSWKEAIADLIPTLKPTTLTGWQKEAIAEKFEVTGAIHSTLLQYVGNFVIQRSGARKKDGIPNNTIRLSNQPMFTVKAMSGKVRVSVKQATIVLDGIPYEADSRCLARWQSIPDSYQFSGNLVLDTMAIGNAVPPLMLQKIITSTLEN